MPAHGGHLARGRLRGRPRGLWPWAAAALGLWWRLPGAGAGAVIAGGEAWLLTPLAQGDAVPLLVKVSTSGKSAYDELTADLGLLLQLQNTSAVSFYSGYSLCKDVLFEAWNLPAPRSCETSGDGSELRFTFHRDEALRPATDYFFVTHVVLFLPGASVPERTVFVETYDDYRLIDAFGFVLPTLVAAVPGPRLRRFEVATSTASGLQQGERFTLRLTLAAESDDLAVDIGRQETLLIWAMPLAQWDFAGAGSCAVQIGTDSSTSSGTCRFRRFPDSDDPVVRETFGLNVIELSPGERIGAVPKVFRLALVAPASGGALPEQHRWLAQPLRAAAPSQRLLASPYGLAVQARPFATVGHATNAAAGARNEVVVIFTTGLTFSGAGFVRLRLPAAFVMDGVFPEVLGFGRVAGEGPRAAVENGREAVVTLAVENGVYAAAPYALRVSLRNPLAAALPTACAESLAALGPGAPGLGVAAAAAAASPAPAPWQLEVSVGTTGRSVHTAYFRAFDVVPPLKSAVLAPSYYAVSQGNTLTVLLRLSVGLLTVGASLKLEAPEEFLFACSTFAAGTVPLTTFPVMQTCAEAPGLLTLALAPGDFVPAETALSFQVDVANPSMDSAVVLERRSQTGNALASLPLAQLRRVLAARTAWALSVESRGVVCQAQADVESPHRTEAWRLFHHPMSIDSIRTSGVVPDTEVLFTFLYRFSSPVPRDAVVTFFAPVGYEFLDYYDVDRDTTRAEVALPMLLPVVRSSARANEVSLNLYASARPGVSYGLRVKVKNARLSPGSQDRLSLNRWRVQATLPSAAAAGGAAGGGGSQPLGGRLAAGARDGIGLAVLQACEVQPSVLTFSQFNEVVISFVVRTSIYSWTGSTGRIRVTAPPGYDFPAQCIVRPALPTLELPQGSEASFRSFTPKSCQGAGNFAVIQVDESSAIPSGSHVRFRVGVTNAAEQALEAANGWEYSTTQGVVDLEACESPATGFILARGLDRAACFAGAGSGDLRPGGRSVYRLSFVYPVRTAEEETQAAGVQPRSQLTVVVPEGFATLAACLEGAGGSSTEGDAPLPPLLACVGGGRVARFTLGAMVLPRTQYVLSVMVVNPPTAFPYVPGNARWLLRVDNAAMGNIEPPYLRLLQGVRLIPGSTRENSPEQWTKILFQTSTAVPKGGGLVVLLPYAFRPSACTDSAWGLYDAGTDSPLGGAALAQGTPCMVTEGVTAGQHHRVSLYPLSEPLAHNARHVLALRVGNGGFAAHAAETEGWRLETSGPEGRGLDASRTVPSFRIHRDFGQLTFFSPALPSAAGESYEVVVEFLLFEAARRGAVVLRPPPSIRARCGDLDRNATLPAQTDCVVEGDASTWQGQRLVLSSRSDVWATHRPYGLRIIVDELGQPLPSYRRAWRAELVASSSADSLELDGFVLGSIAEEQWQWRGKLQALVVSSASPALGRRYRTVVDFVTITALAFPSSELWVRPPPMITLHEFSCFYKVAASSIPVEARLLPVSCDLPPADDGPCLPHLWQTQPCRDSLPGASPQSIGFAHRRGLRVELGNVAAGSFVRLGVEATPTLVVRSGAEDGRNVWTVSTWQASVEQDVAQVPGYAVRNWIDVTRFLPSSAEPEAEAELAVELWMPAELPARGHLVVRSPAWRGDVLFDLSPAGRKFAFGNLPHGAMGPGGFPEPPALVALTTSVDLEFCCALERQTLYHFSFGIRNPPFDRMPSPLLPELNQWSILTYEPSGEVLHQQAVQGYRLFRAFRSASVALHMERVVGGVAAEGPTGHVLVAVDFALPLGTALHGPAPGVRLLAPLGWQFPAACGLEAVRFGPRTRVAGCRPSGREVQLLLDGEVNPGVEGRAFGFTVAARPPPGAPASDIWVLEALAHVGSPEGIFGMAGLPSTGGELELRLSSYVHGLERPGGLRGEIDAWVELTPRAPLSVASSWRPPAQYLVAVRVHLPAELPLGLANATLRIGGPVIPMKLRCAIPPEPFMAGTLPPGVLCYDFVNSKESLARAVGAHVQVDRELDVVLSVDDLIPLRPDAAYSFTLVAEAEDLDYSRALQHSPWPAATTWSVVLMAGGELQTAPAAAYAAEGAALPEGTIRDFGLQTTSVHANDLAEVSLLFSTSARLRLPAAIEIRPPPDFALDSEPSPLHPALRPLQHGINPFRSASWAERAAAADEEAARRADADEWPPGVPCPHFDLMATGAARRVLAVQAAWENASAGICSQPPTLDASILRACLADSYAELQQVTTTRCTVLEGRAYLWLYHDAQTPSRGQCPAQPWPQAQSSYETMSCSAAHAHEWLPAGQYRLTLRGYNPPETPTDPGRNVWTLTVLREAEVLGGGPRSLVRPKLMAQAPGYEIGAGPRYAQGLSPEGEGVLRGGSLWYDSSEGDRVPAASLPASDSLLDGRVVPFV